MKYLGTMADLFDASVRANDALAELKTFTRTGTSIVPPAADELARKARDDGIARAGYHADAVEPDWTRRAANHVAVYARTHLTFTCEDVRAHAEALDLPQPPDKRAWGSAMLRAAKAGVIRKIGWVTATAPNCHANPTSLWESLVLA